jgi:hypothetical protein
MEILYFSTEWNRGNDKLLRAIETIIPIKDIKKYSHIEDMKIELSGDTKQKRLAILASSSEETLIDIYFIHHLLYKVSSILILSDNEKHTIALGQRMKPNFLFFRDADEDDILSVVWQLVDVAQSMTTINVHKSRKIINPSQISHSQLNF